mmetsp:Transcript_47008/g.147263  ORF Transcript_47008/g.147263 Transcript_47008/m.147263 type:complete len:224 (-) Transcript_47008:288-959(-)
MFCLRNPRPCPLLAVTDPGSSCIEIARDANICTDIPLYRVFKDGKMTEQESIEEYLHEAEEENKLVSFLLGCSFSWEGMLTEAGLIPRHIEEHRNVPMYITNIPNRTSGPFGGFLVVSMRPYRPEQVPQVAAITSRFPGAHGGPIHSGDPDKIGISPDRLGQPDFGDAVTIRDGELPVFWACGVTPQTAIMAAALPLVITHSPGHMFVTDILIEEMDIQQCST